MKDQNCDCISYDLDPSPDSFYTIKSAKFAIEAKNYVKLHWRPSLSSKASSDMESEPSHHQHRPQRKLVACFPFLLKLKHKKVKGQIKSSSDEPETEIILQELLGESSIIKLADIQRLGEELPPRAIGFPWRLQFCSSRDGYSLHNLYRKLNKCDSPVLVIIEDLHGRVFGALSSATLRISDKYFGTSECFLFTCFPEFEVHKWHGDNFYFVFANENFMAFGSGLGGGAGLWFDSDLNKGRTDSCLTYGNPPLIPESDFIIKNLECWTFG